MGTSLFLSHKEERGALIRAALDTVLSGGDFSHFSQKLSSSRLTRRTALRAADEVRNGEAIRAPLYDAEAVKSTLEDLLNEIDQRFTNDAAFRELIFDAVADSSHAIGDLLRKTDAAKRAFNEQFAPVGQSNAELDGARLLREAIDALALNLLLWVRDNERFAQQQASAQYAKVSRQGTQVHEIHDAIDRPPADDLVRSSAEAIRQRCPQPLIGRKAEMQDAYEHILGDGAPYLQWIGPPKAGKSGLAYTIAANAFPDVDVVPFFIIGADRGRNNRSAFIEKTGAYLAQLAGKHYGPPAIDSAGSDVVWEKLLAEAARRVRSRDRRLLLLVDGLDEDDASRDGSWVPSIAALLPSEEFCLMHDVRVITTARPNPPLPRDVPPDHPLFTKTTARSLAPSPEAWRAIDPAEVTELMTDERGREIAAFLTATGAPLTITDLAHFTGFDDVQIEACLRSFRSRILVRVTTSSGDDAYELGHATVHDLIWKSLAGGTLSVAGTPDGDAARRYLLKKIARKITEVADRMSESDWLFPAPFLLTASFVSLVQETQVQDVEWLIDLLTSDARRTAVERNFKTVLPALQQLTGLATDIEVDSMVSVERVSTLLLVRDFWRQQSLSLPAAAVAAYAYTGQTTVALHLAETLELDDRVEALCDAIVYADDKNREAFIDAARIAVESMDDVFRSDGFRMLAEALAKISPPTQQQQQLIEDYLQESARLARENEFTSLGTLQLCKLSYYQSEHGETEKARLLVSDAKKLQKSYDSLAGHSERIIAQAVARTGDAIGAMSIVDNEWQEFHQRGSLIDVARALVSAGLFAEGRDALSRAHDLITKSQDTLGAVDLAKIAEIQIALGDEDDARRTVNTALELFEGLPPTYRPLSTLDEAIPVLAKLHDTERALSLADSFGDEEKTMEGYAAVASVLLRSGEPDEAAKVIDSIAVRRPAVHAFVDLARTKMSLGDRKDVEALLRQAQAASASSSVGARTAKLMMWIADCFTARSESEAAKETLQRAYEQAKSIADPSGAAASLREIATTAISIEDSVLAQQALSEARRRAQEISSLGQRITVSATIVSATLRTDQGTNAVIELQDAVKHTDDLLDALERNDALEAIIRAKIAAGELCSAARDAQLMPDDGSACRVLLDIADEFIAQHDRPNALSALRAATERPGDFSPSSLREKIAISIARAGDIAHAHRVLSDPIDPHFRATGLVGIAETLITDETQQHTIETLVAEAETVAAAFDDFSYSVVRRRIAVLRARAGQPDTALSIIDDIPLWHERSAALIDIARIMFEHDDDRTAHRALTDSVCLTQKEQSPSNFGSDLLSDAAILYADSGHLNEALRLTPAILNTEKKALLLIDLAIRQARRGEIEPAQVTLRHATEAATSIHDPDMEYHVLEKLATAWSKAGASEEGLLLIMRHWQSRGKAPELFALASLAPRLALALAPLAS